VNYVYVGTKIINMTPNQNLCSKTFFNNTIFVISLKTTLKFPKEHGHKQTFLGPKFFNDFLVHARNKNGKQN